MRWWRRTKKIHGLAVRLAWAGEMPIVLMNEPEVTLAQSVEVHRWLAALHASPPEHVRPSARPLPPGPENERIKGWL